MDRSLLSGDEAVALAALHAGVILGTGYPGTPSTEILEAFFELGGKAQWAPNEKVALEVGLGAAFAGGRALVTMKHVGLNVAADPLFTAAYTGVSGALVVVSADDPGMASSQNEQDNRHYAVAAGLPMVEPADAQQAYDYFLHAITISERWGIPVIFRMTTRVCHSKSVVISGRTEIAPPGPTHFEHDLPDRVMIPAYARPAHKRLRAKLAEIAAWGETCELNREIPADATAAGAAYTTLGLVASGVSVLHAAEAAPGARILALGLTYPLPIERVRAFAGSVDRCVVIEEGDPVMTDTFHAAGIDLEGKPETYRFGELNVGRVRRILGHDALEERPVPTGKAPELCSACPYHTVYNTLRKHDCIGAGDIGCYSLGVLPPYQVMDTLVDMGASIPVGLGLRHALPDEQARRVVSIIGDSTFIHSGIPGLVEMIYNPPPTGHVVIVLDNGTTAMTGQQEHPATGRTMEHTRTGHVSIEGVAQALGIPSVTVMDPYEDPDTFERLLIERLEARELSVIVARRPCVLAAADIRRWEQAAAAAANPIQMAPEAAVAAAGAATGGAA